MWCPRCCLFAVRLNAARMSGTASVVGGGDKRKKVEEEEEEEEQQPGVGLRGHGQPPTKKLRNKKSKGGRYVPPPGKKNLGISFGHQHFSETQYYFENGLRKVFPYYFDFQTYCKGRWVGKTLREVFSSEFRVEPIEYYTQAAKAGRIRLNEEPADLNTVLKEVVVVDKPASIPVHPCGRFRHNTVIFILGKEHGLTELHTIHRLDRLASGVLMFAKTLEVSKKMDQQVRERQASGMGKIGSIDRLPDLNHWRRFLVYPDPDVQCQLTGAIVFQVQKEYVCRVQGEFPDGEIACEEPILVISYKVGVCRVHPTGKPCKTVFQKLSYNGTSSLVRCSPYTGRTHQIRVHLQYLGHPIVNDPVYNTEAWGPNRGRGGTLDKTDDELLKALVDDHRLKESLDLLEVDYQCTGKDDHKGSTNSTPPLVGQTDPFADVRAADEGNNGVEVGRGKASDHSCLEPTAGEREVKPVPVKDTLC
eukprot:g48016.t1